MISGRHPIDVAEFLKAMERWLAKKPLIFKGFFVGKRIPVFQQKPFIRCPDR